MIKKANVNFRGSAVFGFPGAAAGFPSEIKSVQVNRLMGQRWFGLCNGFSTGEIPPTFLFVSDMNHLASLI